MTSAAVRAVSRPVHLRVGTRASGWQGDAAMQPLRETRPTLRPLAGFAALAMLAWLAFVAALDQRMAPLSSSGLTADAEAGAPTRSAGAWGKLPLSFEANVGQAEGGVDFLARGSGYTLFLKSAEAVLALRQAARSEEHTSELQSQFHLVCRLLLEKKKKKH